MGMQVGDSGGEDDVVSAINTTPLVDVMLVLLIIFLITIPVATHTVKVQLPKDMNQPTQTKLSNVVLAVTADGQTFWDETPIKDRADLLARLEKAAVQKPQPQIQIRGDVTTRYESVGRLVATCQEAGISHIDFITEKPK
ncbi:biopolymer transport protein ExbD [Acetobacter pasteurianus NBRC 101655]|uniref:ExbD/TolR n=6 Tax=Acetobacter TaxID=434 RepID=C7JAV0_ACEP3|nr:MULTISPECIES: biopolymer transporter ExbD [Bacteria]BAU37148.1 biopolymer transport protein ExbD [Acetobacter pasteurianus NBRC 101655]AKR47710.1 biopolymer transporter ExbD [Acetobacter pasteurianus]AKR48254.1 biopolymer transporter ExbD [Acetobacter pasteurianus]ARW47608.1 Biopolymer transport protein ExbD [Acetobacter pasteurianus subsp. pasteurianus]ARW48214.1 Biopolymer transport protein ExbD [Acetobacter pasteurianus subsp. pasteurianus]